MTTDSARELLREAADKLRYIHGALPPNDAAEWKNLIDTADRITALLSENADGWISVDNGLPLVGVSVLVYEPKRHVQKTCHDGRDWILPHKSNVTHWQPLPTPPKNGGK